MGWGDMDKYEREQELPLSTPPPVDPKTAERQAERIINGTARYEVPVDPTVRAWAIVRFDHLHEMGELEATFYRREAAQAYRENLEAFRDDYPDAWSKKHRAVYHLFAMEMPSAKQEAA